VLGGKAGSPGDSYTHSGYWNAWRLTVSVVLPGDVYNVSGLRGEWRLAARVPRQAVWKRISPGGSKAVSVDNA